MAALHAALQSLQPVSIEEIPTSNEGLCTYIRDLLIQARLIVESVPEPPSPPTTSNLPAGSKSPTNAEDSSETLLASTTLPALIKSSSTPALGPVDILSLRSEWGQPINRIDNAKENPLRIPVYKLRSIDGKGAWFARRSVHAGSLPYSRFEKKLQSELAETMKLREKIASRDFVTLLVTSKKALEVSCQRRDEGENENSPPPRNFIVISKPCAHPDVPIRKGFVRGQYESVEMIRELPAPIEGDSSGASENKGDANPVEWIMITRSDPGGSIPRWMVEKGTVPSIVSDAKKFIDWASQDQPKSESTDEDFSTSQPSHDSGKYEEKQQQLKTGPGERVSKQCTPGRQAPAKERRSSEVKSSHGEVDSMPSHEVGFAAGLFDYIDLPTTSKHPGDETDESQVNDGIRDGGGNVTRTSTASRNMNNASPSSSTASFVSADSQLGDMQGNKEDSIPNSPGIGNNNSPVMFNPRVTSSTSNSIFSLKQEFTPPNAYDKELARIFDRKNKVLRDLELNHSQRNELVSQVSQPHAPDVNASDEIQERIASPSKRGKDATSNKRSLATLERKEVKLNSQLNKIEAQQQKIAAKIELKRRKELEKDERIRLKVEDETLKKNGSNEALTFSLGSPIPIAMYCKSGGWPTYDA
ncbi:hypothetical protein CISG_01993 [Coccidioides immitis RMSCC 3703]|uniref:DUF3074 domain-containing protein n=1 Tax=Coccidioides immitis RMSCC 3703 TaxID=454286 RepID=A0A0J8R5A4_COCIT|nr:hypothetical protein CISG_01993 [Coccidioides immitis RMSCC 3703]